MESFVNFTKTEDWKEMEKQFLQKEKVLNITVTDKSLWLNGKLVKLDDFTNEVDNLTKAWTEEEKKNYSVHFRVTDSKSFDWAKLQEQFKKTALYKISPRQLLPPPPPPPAHAASKMGDNPPPPPAPAPEGPFDTSDFHVLKIVLGPDKIMMGKEDNISLERINDYIRDNFSDWVKEKSKRRALLVYQLPGVDDKRTKELWDVLEAFKINSVKYEKAVIGHPAPPPPPPSPKQMIESAEDIYYNGKKISKDEASKLFKNADQYNIMLNNNSGKKILTIAEKKGQ